MSSLALIASPEISSAEHKFTEDPCLIQSVPLSKQCTLWVHGEKAMSVKLVHKIFSKNALFRATIDTGCRSQSFHFHGQLLKSKEVIQEKKGLGNFKFQIL